MHGVGPEAGGAVANGATGQHIAPMVLFGLYTGQARQGRHAVQRGHKCVVQFAIAGVV